VAFGLQTRSGRLFDADRPAKIVKARWQYVPSQCCGTWKSLLSQTDYRDVGISFKLCRSDELSFSYVFIFSVVNNFDVCSGASCKHVLQTCLLFCLRI